MKRYFLVLLAMLIAVTAFARGGAQGSAGSGYPNRPVEITNPSSPGSTTDLACRLIQPFLQKYLGVPVTIRNIQGSNSTVWMLATKNAAPDGYTWGMWTLGNIAAASVVGELVGRYDASKDLVYGGLTYIAPNAVFTPKDRPWNNLKELAAAAEANPGKITWVREGPTGNNADHIREYENSFPNTKGKFTIIDGMIAMDARAAMMGGHLDVMTDYLSTSLDLVNEGYYKMLGIGSAERVPIVPDVPTYLEQGYNYANGNSEWGFMAPIATPKEVVDIFREAMRKAANDPEYIAAVEKTLNPHIYMDGEQTYQRLMDYYNYYVEIKPVLDEILRGLQ